MNEFKRTAQKVCNRLKRVGIKCHITHYNKFNNSVYVRLGDLQSEYNGIRFSNHFGKLNTRYSVRSDMNQSKKILHEGKQYFLYSMNDIDGMILRIMKEPR